jgi:hypothetical protein
MYNYFPKTFLRAVTVFSFMFDIGYPSLSAWRRNLTSLWNLIQRQVTEADRSGLSLVAEDMLDQEIGNKVRISCIDHNLKLHCKVSKQSTFFEEAPL